MSIENRLAAKKRSKQARARRIRNRVFKIIGICMIPVIIALIGYAVLLNRIEKNAASDSYINSDGTIDAKAAKNYVTMCDYKNITISREDNLPTESEVQKLIDNALSSNTETVTESGTVLPEDAKVTLAYTVTADGTEMTDYAETDRSYTLGSNVYTENFDKAIASHKVGDDFEITIEFEDAFSNTNYAGKTVVFKGQVKSVDIVPEFTDEFVAEKLKDEMDGSEYPLTAEGYRNFCANNLFEENVKEAVGEYIVENTEVKSYPWFYTTTRKYLQEKMYDNYVASYNAQATQYGYNTIDSAMSLLGITSKSEYKDRLKSDARSTAKYFLAYQAIFEDAGLEAITEEDVKAFVEENEADYDELVESNGYNYLAQQTLRQHAFDYVMTLVKYDGDSTKMWVPDTATQSDAN